LGCAAAQIVVRKRKVYNAIFMIRLQLSVNDE